MTKLSGDIASAVDVQSVIANCTSNLSSMNDIDNAMKSENLTHSLISSKVTTEEEISCSPANSSKLHGKSELF